MHLDVVDLRGFYYRTRLGRSAQRALQEALLVLWPDCREMVVVGFDSRRRCCAPSPATRAGHWR